MTEQSTPQQNQDPTTLDVGRQPLQSQYSLRRVALIGAVLLSTLIALGWALNIRRISGYPPLPLADLINFDFDTYETGIVFQELLFPLALFYLLSSTGYLCRMVGDQAAPKDALKLFVALAIIQLLAINYSIVTGELTTFGILVVIVGGLLGGWRVGLGLGLLTMLMVGTQELILYPDQNLVQIYQAKGASGFFNPALLSDTFFWYYLGDLGALSAVWAGLLASMIAELLGERRFAPLASLLTGAGISLGAGGFAVISWENPTYQTVFLAPATLLVGLALVAVGLIVRGVQAEASRRKAAAAELARAQAETRALRAQINPHFFFNTLNTIRYFVRTDPENARRLLLNLSQIFQRVLRSGEFVPLQDEIDYVEAYLALEKSRLDERLRIIWSIPEDPSLLEVPVPTLILQPVVENAVIHGISRQPKGGSVNISALEVNGDLMLQVDDDGPGIDPERLAKVLDPAGDATAVGLRNVDGRLRALYGHDYGLQIESQPGNGAKVVIRIPLPPRR